MFLDFRHGLLGLIDPSHMVDWVRGFLILGTAPGNFNHWFITPKFIKHYDGTFPGSIIFITACHSLENTQLSQAFITKGAQVVFGWNHSVTWTFAKTTKDALMVQMLDGGMTAGQAYQAVSTALPVDTDSGADTPPAVLVLDGATDATLPPAVAFTIMSGSQSAKNGQTLNVSIPSGASSATVSLTSPSGGDVSLDGVALSSLRSGGTVSFQVGSGTHSVSLVLLGITVQAIVVVTSSPTTGTITVQATLDGAFWPSTGQATANYYLNGPGTVGVVLQNSVPATKSGLPLGLYALMTMPGGGPPNSTLSAVTPSLTQTLAGGQTITFTLQFKSNPPTAGYTMSSGNQSANEGQTLNLTVSTGATASVNFDATMRSSAVNGGTVKGWQWSINSASAATTSSFSHAFNAGTYVISLTVTDSRNAQSSPVQGTIVVTETAPIIGDGWRMGGYDGQRTNRSKGTGSTSLPQFQTVITAEPAALYLIDPDGSLIFFDGNSLYSYTSGGTLRWQKAIPVYGNPYPGTEIIIGPSGTIYSITPNDVRAWNKDTGAMVWQAPVTIPNSGDERGGSITDNAGNLYINTGANYVGVPQELTSLTPDGTVRWQSGFYGRGYFSPVLSADEKVVYIAEFGCDYFCGAGYLHGLDTTTGHVLYTTGYVNFGLFAPWNTYLTTAFNSNPPQALACTQDLSACPSFPGNGVRAIAGSSVAVSTSNGSIIGLSQQGSQLWAKTETFGAIITDAAGTVFAVAPNTSDLVAINGTSGAELWRQHFTSTPSSVLLADDGCLYVSSNSVLYKGCH